MAENTAVPNDGSFFSNKQAPHHIMGLFGSVFLWTSSLYLIGGALTDMLEGLVINQACLFALFPLPRISVQMEK
jgi:hypothetical protein